MTSYLLVIGDREALGWILTSGRMAFPSAGRPEVAALTPGDELFLYTTRGCFKNPTRDRGRVIAQTKVSSTLEHLARPMHFASREFPVGCTLEIGRLARMGDGLELAPLVDSLDAFTGLGSSWSTALRRPLVRLSEPDADTVRSALAPLLVGHLDEDPASDYTRWWLARPDVHGSGPKGAVTI